ncbi:MAG: PAS domain-containing protein [Clostridia bacterium]|nr:PAS domain-containing protein [Clostridia bacterium]
MFWKSLQLKLIFVFVILIVTIILGIGLFSFMKIEEVYYTGFVDEMLNNIAGYNFNVAGIERENNLTAIETYGPEMPKRANIDKFYSNFRIYFSLNNATRYGAMLDSNYQDVLTGNPYPLTKIAKECISIAESSPQRYAVLDDEDDFCYVFAYIIENDLLEDGRVIIVISQSKAYINRQINEIGFLYFVAVIIILFVTLLIAIVTSRSITKPIELLTNKAELMAQGNISLVTVMDKQKAGYEISKLIDTFNILMTQIQNNMNDISSEKNKLETILMHLTDGVLAFNTNGRLIHANPAAKKMLEISSERTFEEIFKKYELDENLEKIIYLDEWSTTDKILSVNGKYFNVFFAPFRNEKDIPTGVIVVVHDTTKQAKLDDMRKEFVSNVSHELKTPLTSIKTYAETLLEQGEDDLDEESRVKFLNVILSEANRMSRLVADLLQLSKFDYKNVAWNKINFDIADLTKQICEKHKIQAEKKNQILECYVTSNVPEVYGDRDGIERVITNILINSVKYTPEGGNIKVYIGAVHDDAYIKIIDNGIGIPEKDLPRVFERFYRVDKARSREMGGTGLGLPIAKEIIEANNGSIDIKSEVNKGTEVIIKVPTYKPNNKS